MIKKTALITAVLSAVSITAHASDNINIFVNGRAVNTGAFIMNEDI